MKSVEPNMKHNPSDTHLSILCEHTNAKLYFIVLNVIMLSSGELAAGLFDVPPSLNVLDHSLGMDTIHQRCQISALALLAVPLTKCMNNINLSSLGRTCTN